MNNNFYTCNYFLFIYETKEMAQEAANWYDEGDAARPSSAWMSVWWITPSVGASFWSRILRSKVMCANPEDTIFVMSKEDKYWNVIIGEKIGWVIVVNGLVKPVEMTT
jgi:hypothetical protein